MRGRTTCLSIRGAFAAIAAVGAFGCGPSPITPERIQTAIAPTFANLVHIQLSRLNQPHMTAPDLTVSADCRKRTTGSSGAGDWQCVVVWQAPDGRLLRDAYEVLVSVDGCYTATIEGGSMGEPILKAADGSSLRNLLYTFEGCFDTT
jgi:hypothetical protein